MPIFIIGLLLEAISRLLDIYITNLGNIFSEMSIWILFGIIISIYSTNKKDAMVNMFLFCIGMLLTYYFTWMTKEKGIFSKIISIGIILVSVLSNIILFDKLRISDYIIDGLLFYYLFVKKINR